jgi:ABC-type nitrate/sulfonate/bicarbonate transport system substrate-binding protein
MCMSKAGGRNAPAGCLMHARRSRVVHMMPLVALLVAGTAAAAPMAALRVTVFTSPGVLDAPMIVGIAKGIFERQGLRIQSVPVATGFESLKTVADGTAQIGMAAGTAIAQTLGGGGRLKVIAGSNGDATGTIPTDSYVAIIARGANGIREGHLEDLRGKKVGVRRGSDFHQYLFFALAAKGLDPVDGVTLVDTADLAGALRSGAADAVVGPEPGVSRILQSASGAILVQRGGNHMQFLELRVASSQYLATHPGTIKRFVTAFAEAAQFVRTHPDETADIMIQRVAKDFPRESIRTTLGFLRQDPRVSRATVQAAQAGADFAMKIGALRRAPTFEDMFDLRALRQVEREHPELFRDLPPVPDVLRLSTP